MFASSSRRHTVRPSCPGANTHHRPSRLKTSHIRLKLKIFSRSRKVKLLSDLSAELRSVSGAAERTKTQLTPMKSRWILRRIKHGGHVVFTLLSAAAAGCRRYYTNTDPQSGWNAVLSWRILFLDEPYRWWINTVWEYFIGFKNKSES